MKDVLTTLREQVSASSLVDIAIVLGHNNTQTISRWLKTGKIPDGKVKGVKALLDANKSKAKRVQ